MRRILLLVGVVALAVAAVAAPDAARVSASRTWPPFVLVAGLLLIGVVAHEEGTFDRAAGAASRIGGGDAVLLVALLGLVAVVTAVLNLDTAAAFLTPVLILAARRRRAFEEPFVYGALLMANAASLLLPGSNLTNLLILSGHPVSGATFAARMFPAWLAAIVVTAAAALALRRRRGPAVDAVVEEPAPSRPPARGWLGAAAAVAAAVVMIALRSAALPVAAIGLAAVSLRLAQRRVDRAAVAATVDVAVLAGLFGAATALGTLARSWSGPGTLMGRASSGETAAIGALAAVAINNLPAAALLGAHTVAHPNALLLGLDLGPNLAVTGSLSSLLWFQACRSAGVRPSPAKLTRIGLFLVPVSIGVALLALRLF